jgi:hypothetical protein
LGLVPMARNSTNERRICESPRRLGSRKAENGLARCGG